MKAILKLGVFSLCTFLFTLSCDVEPVETVLPESRNETKMLKGCETAFGYFKYQCFREYDFKRWGWVIGPLSSPFEDSYDLYAAAGKCDIDKGFKAGTVSLNYADGSLTVDIAADPG